MLADQTPAPLARRVALLGLFATCTLPFLLALPNHWVWDDKLILGERLPLVSSIPQLWAEPFWGSQFPDTYRPLGISLLYVQRICLGEAAWAYRVVSLLLHFAVSALVLRLAIRLTAPPIAWMAALIFAAHPVHAEAVVMTYGQLELLAALFTLLALEAYLRDSHAGLLASACLAFLAFCSKESALMLPALALLIRRSWRAAAFLIPALFYLALRWSALGDLLPSPDLTLTGTFSAALRIKAVLISLGEYIRLAIWPAGQTLYYGHLRDALLTQPWSSAAWIATALVGCFSLDLKLGKNFSFSWKWFLLALLPVLNFVPTGVLVAERTLYLPVFGISLAAALCIATVQKRSLQWILCLAILITATAAAARLVVKWRSEETLWRSTIAAHPRSPMAHVWLGQTLLSQSHDSQHLAEADQSFQRALELNQELAPAMRGKAAVAADRGDCATANRWLEQANRISTPEDVSLPVAGCP
jgi:hypothetical protein